MMITMAQWKRLGNTILNVMAKIDALVRGGSTLYKESTMSSADIINAIDKLGGSATGGSATLAKLGLTQAKPGVISPVAIAGAAVAIYLMNR